MADELSSIVATGPQRLATGFGFTEGPVWHPDGHWLFVDIPRNLIYRLAPGGIPEVFRDNSGGSNGLTFDLRGNLILCEGSNRQMTRREADGSYTPIATQIDGKHLNHPNDVAGRSDGSLYFTDPTFGMTPEEHELDFAGVPPHRPRRLRLGGDPRHRAPPRHRLLPDESTLYVVISRAGDSCIEEKERGVVCRHQFIRAFDVATDGSLSNNRIFAGMHSNQDGVPDGMKVDIEGRVYCTGSGGCWVFAPSGDLIGVIVLPEVPANCAWGGADNRTMLFTARTSVFSMEMTTPGTAIHSA